MSDDSNYKELIALISGLDNKLDIITNNLSSNHTKLEARVNACEDEIDTIKNRPRDEKINIKNEIIKTVIHWGIPVFLILLINAISNGSILAIIK